MPNKNTSLRFLSVHDVLHIHENTILHEGGGAGLRDPGLLESAVLTPQQQFEGVYLHKDIAAMAAAYLFHIVSNHPFADGNKRTGALAALVFLDVNGVARLPEAVALEKIVIQLAAGKIDKPALTRWMRKQITR